MNVLIVHFHLKPGGVSSVIRHQVSALRSRGILVAGLFGELPPTDPGFACSLEPALAYAPEDSAVEPDSSTVGAILASIRKAVALLGPDTVVHVHNPTLRKNPSLLPALNILADEGLPLLLHVHDLAEDWRPTVYAPCGYPEGAAWATINSRDARALRAAGAGAVHEVPNAVFSADELSAYEARRRSGSGGQVPRSGADRATVLYPVRGIRRKNLGEALLLSLFLDEGRELSVTLPPNSPRDMPYYGGWMALTARLAAPMRFGAGLERGLDENYGRSFAIVTTSIKEGFGLTFLEALIHGYPLLGRGIGHALDDLAERGVAFPRLYEKIAAPAGLYDLSAMRSRARIAGLRCGAAYGLADGGERLASAIEAQYDDGVDFGRLDETAQAEILTAVSSDASARSSLAAANPFLEGWASGDLARVSPSGRVLSAWSEESYGLNLESVYRSVLGGGVGAAPSRAALLDCYLDGATFHAVGI